jgi:hypothetical protein
MHFDGSTYTHDRDGKRLGQQYLRVFGVMKDGQWRSLSDIRRVTKDPESSVSARLRDMRKERFGSLQVERRYVADGLYEYKLNLGDTAPVLKDEKPAYEPGKVTMTVDGWTLHDGKSVPVIPKNAVVHVKFRDGYIDDSGSPNTVQYWTTVCGHNNWLTAGTPGSGRGGKGAEDFDIVAYKIVKP